MKKPTLALVPSPPKPPPGEPRRVPFQGELGPFDPSGPLVIVERKAPYFTVVCSPAASPEDADSSAEK